MKKQKILLYAILLVAMALPQSIFAYDFSAVAPTGQTLYYDILSSTTVSVACPNTNGLWSGFVQPSGTLTIPSSVTYGGTTYAVTEIGLLAFGGCSSLTSVTIPTSVVTIGSGSFIDCTGLTSITIPNSVTHIYSAAFQNCIGLTSVTIPTSITNVYSAAFQNCIGLTTVNYNADSCSTFQGAPFYGDTNITTINIGQNVKIIPEHAFYGCSGVTSITIPRNIKSIGGNAFWGCTNLTTVNFNADSCTNMGYISDSNYVYYVFGACNVTTVNIGSHVKMIPDGGFSGCTNLQSITIPDSVESIGNLSFFNCTGLTSITIPRRIKSIGRSAFAGCSNLTTVNFNADSCTNMGYDSDNHYVVHVFGSSVTTVNIGSHVKMIPDGGFSGCTNLQSITIHDSVASIGNLSFATCTGLTSITIPRRIKSIGRHAFYYCSNLATVNYNADSCTYMGYRGNYSVSSVFSNCNVSTVNIGSHVKMIPDGGFAGCSSLQSITIPDSVESIGILSFINCTGLTSITIPRRIKSIGDYAFYGCSNLATVNFNADSCTYMGYDTNTHAICRAFANCGVNAINIGNNVKTIPNYAFFRCYVQTIIIPDSVEYVGDGAFHSCDSLESLVIGNSVDSIGGGAFYGCTGLTSITAKPAVAPMTGANAFYNVPDSIPVYIPCGSTASYTARWNNFNNFVGELDATVSVSSIDVTMGTASVVTQPTCAEPTATIVATPNTGYLFAHWSDGDTANPRMLTVDRDTLLTAYFALVPDTITYHDTIVVRDTIFIHDTTIVHDTTYVDNYVYDTIIVHDTVYVNIYVHDTTIVNNYIHDTVVINNYIYDTTFVHDTTIVNNYFHDTTYIHDTTIVDNYIHDTITVMVPIDYYTLSLASEQPTKGIVVGSGTFSDGTVVEIAAVAVRGNHFVQWSDGNTENPRHVTVTEDINLTASFADDEVGVADVQPSGVIITAQGNVITVQGAEGQRVRIFDVVGRLLSTEQTVAETQHFRMMAAGVYLVQVGDGVAQRVVVR